MPFAEAVELALKAAGVIAGGLLTIWQGRAILPANRSRLKADLEILRLIDSADPLHKQVKANVDRDVDRIYPDVRWRRRLIYSWTELLVALTFALGFAAWTIYLDREGFTWWSLLTGVLAVSGIMGIVRAFDGSRFYQDLAAALKSDLRNLVTVQESYFADNLLYSDAIEKLSYWPSRHVTVRLTHITHMSWAAAARHEPSGLEYGIFVGGPPPGLTHRLEGEPFPIAAPAKFRHPPAA